MRRKKWMPIVIGMVMALSLFGCGDKTTEPKKVDVSLVINANEEKTNEDSFDQDFNLENYDIKNSVEGREYNFVCFQNEETVSGIETLSVTIYNDKDEVLEEFVIQNPNLDDHYCISPVLIQGEEAIASYRVDFCVNGTNSWSRSFEADPTGEMGPKFNVVSVYQDENGTGYGSCLAG